MKFFGIIIIYKVQKGFIGYMTTIICKVGQCYYCSPSGFCQNHFVTIQQNGFCGRIYDNNGGLKQNWNQPIQPKERKDEIVDEES